MTPSGSRRNPLSRQIAWRMAAALLATLLAGSVLAVWFHAQSRLRFLDTQVRHAEAHYRNALAMSEIAWENDAYNFKARLEHARVLEDAAHRQSRLANFIVAQGGVPDFPLAVILDRDGRKLAEFEYGSRRLPEASFSGSDVAWAYDDVGRTLYRVFRQQVWLGQDRNGSLLLYRPLDHAVLVAMAFPETRLSLVWQGLVVASSLGDDGMLPARVDVDAEPLPSRRLLPWTPATPDNPRLLIDVNHVELFGLGELLLSFSPGILVFIAMAWLSFGLWATVLVRRILALANAQRDFAASRQLTPLAEASLNQADDERHDELSHLAASLRRMMGSLADYQQERESATELLRQSEERYRFLVEGARVVAWEFSLRDGRFTYVSSRAGDLLGIEAAAWLEPDFLATHLHPDDAARVAEARQTATDDGSGCSLDYRLRHIDGYYIWVHHLSAARGPSADREQGVVRGILLDIGERKQLEQRLALAGLVFDRTSEAIMITDATNRIIAVNPAFEAITGYAMDEVVGKDPKLLNAGMQGAGHFQSMWQALQRDAFWSGEVWNRRKSGEPFAQRLSITVMRDDAGRVQRYLAMFSDVTKEKRQAEAIEHQAAHDALTGLPNRRLLADRMGQAIARAQRNGRRVGIVMLDLDGFKHINDTLGHRVGDLLLVESARRLVHCIRESDTVARVGGDEFMVVLPEIQAQGDLQVLAGKILTHIREPYAIEGKELFVSASIGLTMFPDDGANPEDLLAHADTAMYRAKSDGKNTYRFFTAEMHEHAVARLQVEDDLRQALRAGEFELHYQVVVDLASGLPAKAEALVRWRHPRRGLLDPIEFIPVAEESGMVLQLGAWVIDEAARQAALWDELVPAGFCIGANVSAQQFHRADCAATLRAALATHDVPPQRLSIEITESLFIGDQGDAWRQLNEIRDLGVRIAIDDFGTGYSSLSYLKRFPVDTLKIDQTFVAGLPGSGEGAALVDAIISMGRALGLGVVAEGVETAEQRDFLSGRGCRYGQGYLFGRAMPATEFAARYFGRNA